MLLHASKAGATTGGRSHKGDSAMQRVLTVVLVMLLCTACQNVAAPAPTVQPEPVSMTAQLVGEVDMVVTINNNSGKPLELGGWTIQITPAISPTLVAAQPFPAEFTVPDGKFFRAHTAGGTNSSDILFFSNGGIVPPGTWQKGVKVEMRDPKGEQPITRFIYSIPVTSQ